MAKLFYCSINPIW
ncbi:hypothetical protein B4U79_03055 [Dinothrombium tinctorium]|uniref:Uncharacterized protein n=1 Tax=Dinothrombium tinctorium TaxID=1965070 RepID=A0A3S4QRU2_9ACAR|nr:hypothetical protein B4U79_11575 [Dinothrombium tinctorium]RWS08622.1 hypothetical protein B4U79_08240 [Dinothrombium tinctorium]RWS08634.1 hypothetical protein B4U79_03055 [Dinothrombium tinctorium]